MINHALAGRQAGSTVIAVSQTGRQYSCSIQAGSKSCGIHADSTAVADMNAVLM